MPCDAVFPVYKKGQRFRPICRASPSIRGRGVGLRRSGRGSSFRRAWHYSTEEYESLLNDNTPPDQAAPMAHDRMGGGRGPRLINTYTDFSAKTFETGDPSRIERLPPLASPEGAHSTLGSQWFCQVIFGVDPIER